MQKENTEKNMVAIDRKQVLDLGYVELLSTSGSEEKISSFAGISYQSEKGPLVSSLLSLAHMSPFEFASVTFRVKAPIFVVRQWFRHRTGSYMEKSLRYCEAAFEFYTPESASEDEKRMFKSVYSEATRAYETLIKNGVKKEQARIVLPVALYTEFYFSIDMRNFIHFLELRTDSHAQKEIQDYANAMLYLVEPYFPTIMKEIKERRK